MPNELAELAEHCRVMSGKTHDLEAAREFRILAEKLKKKAFEWESAIERARLKKTAKDS
jgi:hypothetical protein